MGEIMQLSRNLRIDAMNGAYGDEFARNFESLNRLADALSKNGGRISDLARVVAVRGQDALARKVRITFR